VANSAAHPGTSDTIVALASPPGAAARGVLRLSGARAAALASARLVDANGRVVELAGRARGALEARFVDERGTQPVLVVWMPGPGSYTGEDVVELHLVGTPVLLAAALAACVASGARPARAGEFTRRAFENGRIDLVRAEGVLELVGARGEEERRAGLALLSGGLSHEIDALRAGLADVCSLCEASLDFDESETGHVEPEVVEAACREARARVAATLERVRARPTRVESTTFALVGPPNAGKSALFNRLTGGEALVSSRAGTTRDVLAAPFEVGGAQARLLDLPGFHASDEGLDRAAQELAANALASADVLLIVLDAAREDGGAATIDEGLSLGVPRWLVWNRVDRNDAAAAPPAGLAERLGVRGTSVVSARTGAGLEELVRALGALVSGGALADVAARHVRGLAAALAAVDDAAALARAGWPLDAVASTLRGALDALDDLSGRTTAEDLLDRIFARFCLGK
jgi:tRNA modification GTPase